MTYAMSVHMQYLYISVKLKLLNYSRSMTYAMSEIINREGDTIRSGLDKQTNCVEWRAGGPNNPRQDKVNVALH